MSKAIAEATVHGKSQRQRVFMKVKEKLDEEKVEMAKQKDQMLKVQQELAAQKLKEKEEQLRQKQLIAERKVREQEEQKIRDEQRRERNVILQALEVEHRSRALEVLNVLTIKGYKKVGKDKIKDLEKNHDKIDYDSVIEFYQQVLKKEREQIEEDKKKKLREVELWTRALREEEKKAIHKYSEKHGEKEMELIKDTINDRQNKEIKVKQALEPAKPFFEIHMKKQMEVRHAEWGQKKEQFMNQMMNQLKDKILEHAKSELQKQKNLEAIKKRQQDQAERDRLIALKNKEEGTTEQFEGAGGEESWSRGTSKP